MKSSVLFSKKNRNDPKGYLFIIYREKNFKPRKVSLDYSITKVDYDNYFSKDFNQFKKNKKIDFDEINSKIRVKLDENPFVIKKINKEYLFLEYLETRKLLKNNFSTINTYESSANMFRTFLEYKHKVTDVGFVDIDSDFVKEMQKYFINSGLQMSTIRFYVNNYSTVFNEAVNNDIYKGKNPFKENKVSVSSKPKKILTDRDIITLLDIKKDESYYLESRMFLFSLFTNGLRCSDMMLMKYRNIKKEYIEYYQLKTKVPIKVNYSDKVVFILMDLFGLLEHKTKFESQMRLNKPDFTPYLTAKRRMLKKMKYNRVDEDFVSHFGYMIKPNDEESKTIIEEIVRIEKNINIYCKNVIYNYTSKQDKDEFIFKDFVKSKCFNNYKKSDIPMNKEQFDTYKSRFTSYNAKLKRMAKHYKLSIQDITTHVSRFTFTNMLLEIPGLNLNDIRIALGHSNLATTQKYIQTGFDFKKSDIVNSEINYKFR